MKTVIREKRYQIRIDYTDNHWKRLWKNLNKPSSHNDDNILAGTGSCCRTLDARPDNRAIEPWKCHRSSHQDRIIQEYWPLVSPLSPSAEAAELFLPTTCEEEEKKKGWAVDKSVPGDSNTARGQPTHWWSAGGGVRLEEEDRALSITDVGWGAFDVSLG